MQETHQCTVMTKSRTIKDLTIGSKLFVVHKDYSFKRKPGGKVLGARVIGFENVKNKIVPLFKVSGLDKSHKVSATQYEYFLNIKEALTAFVS